MTGEFMRKLFAVLAALSAISVPAIAQADQDTATGQANPQEQAQPKMVKKRVCTKTESETGSRTGGSKVCKTIEVPAEASTKADGRHDDHREAGGSN
jgi:hypothetical protein